MNREPGSFEEPGWRILGSAELDKCPFFFFLFTSIVRVRIRMQDRRISPRSRPLTPMCRYPLGFICMSVRQLAGCENDHTYGEIEREKADTWVLYGLSVAYSTEGAIQYSQMGRTR